jgi:hypothetical protein
MHLAAVSDFQAFKCELDPSKIYAGAFLLFNIACRTYLFVLDMVLLMMIYIGLLEEHIVHGCTRINGRHQIS